MEKEENAEDWTWDPPVWKLKEWLAEVKTEYRSLDQLASFLEPEDLEERKRCLEEQIMALEDWIREKEEKG